MDFHPRSALADKKIPTRFCHSGFLSQSWIHSQNCVVFPSNFLEHGNNREIKTLGDACSLQEDLGKLATWSQSSGLLFNEAKCKAQHITRKTKPILSSYKLNNTALELYAAEKDLGVWISKDLTCYKQVNEQSSRANKLLGYLKRNTRFILRTEVRRTLYLALVTPHLGNATQIWAPQSIELIVKLERIQRRATKFMLKLPYSSNISYKSRLQTLNLIPVCYWHELLDLTFFFQIDTRSC